MIRLLAAAVMLIALLAPATAGDYTMENRPGVHFFGSGADRISPYPQSRRAASIWHSDYCWRDCTGFSSSRFEACIRDYHPEYCRLRLDQDGRACLRNCRTSGGPIIPLSQF